MNGMKRLTMTGLFLWMVVVLAACGGGAPPVAPAQPAVAATSAPPSSGAEAAPTQIPVEEPVQPQEPQGPQVPEIVPVYEGAVDLKVTNDNSYIAYQIPEGTVEEVTKFYQEQLLLLGWEQKNKKDSGFGDSITLLRSRPDYNISVTIQSVSGSKSIRVLISLIPK